MSIDFMSEVELFAYVVDAMAEALLVLDSDLRVCFVNQAAVELLDGIAKSKSPIGMYYFDYVGEDPQSAVNQGNVLRDAIERNIRYKGIIRQLPSGKYISLNMIPLPLSKSRGILLTGQDVTPIVETEAELDMAFGLTLPNSKVEYKLKNTPEFQDDYDPDTSNITITGIIKDGGYRHVVNSLKIFASLKAQGVANVIGIDKDKLVQAIIFHDLGKSQPDLHIGETVDPKLAFEDGKLHAFRGAEVAEHYYQQDADVVELIRYHHHGEHELPNSFPWRLLPMFRLFQLIDGLSAAVTRGGVEVEFSIKDCVVFVTERNKRPQYNGSWSVNLYTGLRRRIDEPSEGMTHGYVTVPFTKRV